VLKQIESENEKYTTFKQMIFFIIIQSRLKRTR
jgi:hypothetical protein